MNNERLRELLGEAYDVITEYAPGFDILIAEIEVELFGEEQND